MGNLDSTVYDVNTISIIFENINKYIVNNDIPNNYIINRCVLLDNMDIYRKLLNSHIDGKLFLDNTNNINYDILKTKYNKKRYALIYFIALYCHILKYISDKSIVRGVEILWPPLRMPQHIEILLNYANDDRCKPSIRGNIYMFLGEYYEKWIKDYARAEHNYIAAHMLNQKNACYKLGYIYQNYMHRYNTMIYFYKKSIRRYKDKAAMLNMGFHYEYNEINEMKMKKYYRMVGDDYAFERIGVYYLCIGKYKKMQYYFRIAILKGSREAERRLKNYYREFSPDKLRDYYIYVYGRRFIYYVYLNIKRYTNYIPYEIMDIIFNILSHNLKK